MTISNNSADNTGGGMFNYYYSPTLTNVTITNNSTSHVGGGMFNYYYSPTLTNVQITNNSAPAGGGVYNYSGNSHFTNVTIANNGTQGFYGSNEKDTTYCYNSILWDNISDSGLTLQYCLAKGLPIRRTAILQTPAMIPPIFSMPPPLAIIV